MRIPDLLRRPWARHFAAPVVAPERITVVARDGVRLALHRLRYPGGGPAVLMLHGLSANRFAFHCPGRSFADWLAQRGFDCYVAELRGAGESERPAAGWDLDDHLHQDLPALIDAVLATSGQEQLHWLGHSMGGMLLYCYATLHPEAPIRSGLTFGSALDYRPGHSRFRPLLPLRPALHPWRSVPFGALVHWVAPLLGRVHDPLTTLNFWPANVEPEIVRRLYANAFHSVPISLLEQLALVFTDGGLTTRDGRVRFLERRDPPACPLRLLAGSRDAQAPFEAVRATAELLGGGASFRAFGRAHGQREDYGHWDLIVGKNAFDEVWPDVLAWLEQHSERVHARGSSPDGDTHLRKRRRRQVEPPAG
jgi:alpha-beta hydrolase superfamily lysophospholipase